MLSRRLILFSALLAVLAEVSQASIPGKSEPFRTYCLTHTDGVESHGGESYLVVHHARMYPAAPNNSWIIPPVDERLPLELCPSTRDSTLTVRVLWQGEAQAAATVTANVAGGKRFQARTNGSGDFTLDASRPGIYTFHSRQIEKTGGERDGKKYSGILHCTTLVVREGGEVPGVTGFKRDRPLVRRSEQRSQRVCAHLKVSQNLA